VKTVEFVPLDLAARLFSRQIGSRKQRGHRCGRRDDCRNYLNESRRSGHSDEDPTKRKGG
jgi:hypothetical protein